MRKFSPKKKSQHHVKSVNSIKKRKKSPARDHAVHLLLHLQQTLGNKAVLHLLRAKKEKTTLLSTKASLPRIYHPASSITGDIIIQKAPNTTGPCEQFETQMVQINSELEQIRWMIREINRRIARSFPTIANADYELLERLETRQRKLIEQREQLQQENRHCNL